MELNSKQMVVVRRVFRGTIPPLMWDWCRARFGGVWRVPAWPTSNTAAGGWTTVAASAAKGYEEGLRRMTQGAALYYLPAEEPSAWFHGDPQFHHRMIQLGLVTARARGTRGVLSILDYGGGFGAHAHALKRLLPGLSFQYTVCELPEFCELGRKFNPDVRFVSSLTEAGSGYNLVYASCSVQYTEDWQKLVRDLCVASAGCVFVARTFFVTNSETFVAMQRAYGTAYPGWIFNQNEFVQTVQKVSSRKLKEVFLNGRGLAVRGEPEPNVQLGLLFE
jgi:putative methyltransferase (TIGR04325 family)